MKFNRYCVLEGFLWLGILLVASADDSFWRNVSTVLICQPPAENGTADATTSCLTHTKAVGPTDTLHYVYISRGTPSLLAARTETPANIVVNWTDFLSGNDTSARSVKFTSEPDVTVALMFTQLIEFDDVDKTAQLDHYAASNRTWMESYSLMNVTWSNISIYNNSTVELTITGIDDLLPVGRNGSVTFKVHVFENSGHSTELPRLPYTANITLIDVSLKNLDVHREKSRLAVEVVVVTSENVGKSMSITKRNSFDDSLTPGSFEYIDWLTDEASVSSGAFLQWKPVCYTNDKRTMQSSTKASNYRLVQYNITDYGGLVFAYFGHSNTHMRASNVSFGGAGDGIYYNNTAYTAWSVSFGFGAPPAEGISLWIILVVAIGLGIPFLLIIAGVIYVIVQRCRARYHDYVAVSNSYAEIN